MATLIICPACETRYETAAVFPPEGRKVRCSKCGNVWQARPVTAQAAPIMPDLKVAVDNPFAAPPPPRPPKATPKPKPAPVNSGLGGFAGIGAAPKAEPSLTDRMDAALPEPDADFGTEEDLAAQVERMNAEAAMAAEGVLPDAKPVGGIFARLTRRAPAAVPPAAPASAEEPPMPGVPPGEAELAALAADEHLPVEGRSRAVAIGWLGLILFVAIILGILIFAKGMVLSVLPGAARLYGSAASSGLTFEGVRYGWANEGGQTVLEIQGDVVNATSSPVAVPQVVIALRDEKGEEISEWTTETGADELAAGEHAPFLRQIPSPPSNVRSVKVRFAKAN